MHRSMEGPMSNDATDRIAAPARELSTTFAKEIASDASVEGIRFLFNQLAGLLNRKLPPVGAFHEAIEIPAPGRTVTVDVMVPAGEGPFPVLVYFHGGAWVAGNPASHRKLTHRLAEGGAVVVSADYRLAPENPSQRRSTIASSRSSGRQITRTNSAATPAGLRSAATRPGAISPRPSPSNWPSAGAVRSSAQRC
jgi:hypothetical protein